MNYYKDPSGMHLGEFSLYSDKELVVLDLILQGYSQAEIADKLGKQRQVINRMVMQIRSRYYDGKKYPSDKSLADTQERLQLLKSIEARLDNLINRGE